jgi:hypothetical protein
VIGQWLDLRGVNSTNDAIGDLLPLRSARDGNRNEQEEQGRQNCARSPDATGVQGG